LSTPGAQPRGFAGEPQVAIINKAEPNSIRLALIAHLRESIILIDGHTRSMAYDIAGGQIRCAAYSGSRPKALLVLMGNP